MAADSYARGRRKREGEEQGGTKKIAKHYMIPHRHCVGNELSDGPTGTRVSDRKRGGNAARVVGYTLRPIATRPLREKLPTCAFITSPFPLCRLLMAYLKCR